VKNAMKRLELDASEHSPAGIQNEISRAKNAFLSPEQYAQQAGSFFEELVAKVYRRYDENLAASNALDFDDLLLLAAKLLRDHEDFRTQWQQRFHYILIDEYQDTNHAQYLIAKHLAAARRNIGVTGDPDQSIYGWRGADIHNILDFQKDYPDAKLVKLEENFRSTQIILDAASGVISHNRERIDRGLFTRKQGGRSIALVACDDEEHEGLVVADEVLKRTHDGRAYGDFAIFYRTNAQSRSLEGGLRSRGIPYTIVGAVEFYNRKEVKDILAYLRLIANERDDVSAARIINVPARSIGETTVAKLRAWAELRGLSIAQAVARAAEAGFTSRALNALLAFAGLLKGLRELPQAPLADLVRSVIDGIGYELMLKTQKDPNADERIDNIRELVNAAAEYDDSHPDGSLIAFLENVALVSDTDALPTEAKQVTLMTLHSAKGLEFPVVFITGMEDNLLPHASAVAERNGEEEERRLCYVGITRAKEELVLTYAEMRRRYGLADFADPSRFIEEIPAHLLAQSVAAESLDEDQDEQEEQPDRVRYDDEWAQEPLELDEHPRGHRKPQRQPPGELTQGDTVMHPSFGPGKVLSVSGSGQRKSARILFSGSEKTIVLKFGKLKRIG